MLCARPDCISGCGRPMDGLFAAFPIHESFQVRHWCGSSNKFRNRKRAPLGVTDAVTSCSRGWTKQRRPSAVRHLVPGLSSPLRRARSPEAMEPKGGAVLHVVVVGFHHKKGGQVEFSYPPLASQDGSERGALPEEWKYLPFLALPDGAHNYQEDTVYFHLPPLGDETDCVYGVSCYRQIEAKVLKVRQEDVTRETVQKSVCVLSRVPLYGLIQAKLQLITHAYFEEKDFSQISILKELYEHMNNSLSCSRAVESQVYLGLSPTDLILHFRHKVLILLKLILLEKKVLFYVSPVSRLVGALMTLLSLFPGMIERGLTGCSRYKTRGSVSREAGPEEFVAISAEDVASGEPEPGEDSTSEERVPRSSPESSESDWETLDPSVLEDDSPNGSRQTGSLVTAQPQSASSDSPDLDSGLQEDQFGQPLAIFTKGYLCMPYMALQQHHLLSDATVRGFVAGATNILFRQQRDLSDAVADVEEANISVQDLELRKILSLTTADLRFMDFLVRRVTETREGTHLGGTGWEGGDEWIRAQFRLYIHSLLCASLHQDDNEKLRADYGASFVSAWRVTYNYRVWSSKVRPAMSEISPGHPFQGPYSAADVKLRLSHSMQNSERGMKLGKAMMSTSQSVYQTGKAVGQSMGGALNSAKSAVSSWFSSLTQPTAITDSSLAEPPTRKQ
ncbi:late secretory pathway protein AVL9 homolog [Paramormyrops kingsleyae]|uniref:late secretory pathway protein AVL9 homolog n=1 Tax=Paramormyrops kingsleyae TaxID=1676925 RepID=UPI003B96BC56